MSEMIDSEIDTFFAMFHGMLRVTPADEKETVRAREVVKWAAEHRSRISKVLDQDEINLFEHVVQHWVLYREAPSRRTLEELVREDDDPDPQLNILGDYDKWQPSLQITDVVEVKTLFRARIASFKHQRFKFVTQQARLILEGQASGTYKDPPKKGVNAARDYLLKELLGGVFNPAAENSGGSMLQLAGKLVNIYDENAAAAKSNKHVIPTGIKVIDDLIGGYNRKTLNLILGTIGQRKSSVARTIAYYAADNGFRTLFICLEWPYEEEIQIFAMMHAHSSWFQGTKGLSIDKLRNGTLTREEYEFLSEYLVPSLEDKLGDNLVIRGIEDRTWANVRSAIEAENANGPVDLVVIDYVTLLDVGPVRDPTYAMNQLIREIKQMALYSNEGRGLVFVSPVQGNRKGYEAAKANEGAWQATDISMYSEMEKSADTVMYCFHAARIVLLNQMKVGFCKARRFGIIPPLLVDVDPNVGLVGGSPQIRERKRWKPTRPVDPRSRIRPCTTLIPTVI